MSFQKLAGIGGIIFGVMLLVNLFAPGAPVAGDASAPDIVKYLTDHSDGIKLAQAAGMLGTLPAIFWGVGLLGRLRAAGGEGTAWGAVGLVGLIMSGAFVTVAGFLQLPFVLRGGLLEDAVLVVNMWQLLNALAAAVFMGLAALLVGYGMGGLRCGVGAKWLNYVAVVGAVLSFIGGLWPTGTADGSPIAFFGVGGFVAFVLFALVTGVEMVRAPAAAPTPQAA